MQHNKNEKDYLSSFTSENYNNASFSPESFNNKFETNNVSVQSWNDFVSDISYYINTKSDINPKVANSCLDDSKNISKKVENNQSDTWENFLSSLSPSEFSVNAENNSKKTSTFVPRKRSIFNYSFDSPNRIINDEFSVDTSTPIVKKSRFESFDQKKSEEDNSVDTSAPKLKKPCKESDENSSEEFLADSYDTSMILRTRREKTLFVDKEKKDFKIKGEIYYRNHMKLLHSIEDFPWNCFDCCINFSKLTEFVFHMKTKHEEIKSNYFECHLCKTIDFSSEKITCKYCNFQVSSIKRMQYHMQTKHLNKTLLKCYYCDKTFKKGQDLTDHIKSYHPNDKVKCELCGACVKCLKTHMKAQHIADPFKCSKCDKQFASNSALQSHEMKIHTGQFRYTCDICGVKLPDYHFRDKHMLSHDKYVDENGVYMPLPEKELKTLNKIVEHLKREAIGYVEVQCGPDEPSCCWHLQCEIDSQKANVLVNSKGTDIFDLKFFILGQN